MRPYLPKGRSLQDSRGGPTIAWGVFTVLGAFAVAFVANVVTGQVKDTTEEKLFGGSGSRCFMRDPGTLAKEP
jgi:hypothetical protein